MACEPSSDDQLHDAIRKQLAEGISEAIILERIRVQLLFGQGQDDWDEAHYGALVAQVARDLHAERRREQQKIARLVGEGMDAPAPPFADRLTLEEAERALTFIIDGRQVVDAQNRAHAFCDMDAAYAGSRHRFTDERGQIKSVSVMRAWLASLNRRTASTLTFAPGRGVYTINPLGVDAFNSWQLRIRRGPVSDRQHGRR